MKAYHWGYTRTSDGKKSVVISFHSNIEQARQRIQEMHESPLNEPALASAILNKPFLIKDISDNAETDGHIIEEGDVCLISPESMKGAN